eukprot:CAMPEP_0184858744 /NCGR_PEP_ID=MMETSP0580-20130426/3813_1 /TAXON_ID=1118495 /ORGANISM="Dactyliosolen fragilissimus" /LENGTH=350 /DNA_ID=CAMNT_0027355047 /DNA_START=53 /DNA_END=1101 /DNA_ORIENTATION=-
MMMIRNYARKSLSHRQINSVLTPYPTSSRLPSSKTNHPTHHQYFSSSSKRNNINNNSKNVIDTKNNATPKKSRYNPNTNPKLEEPNLEAALSTQNTAQNSILHQKAAKAAEINAELHALLEKQAKRQAEEANRAFGAGFLDFIKKNRGELINIFASFFCVLLAWQIHGMRNGARRLLGKAEEDRLAIDRLRDILQTLDDATFRERILNQLEEELLENKGTENTESVSFLSRWKRSSASEHTVRQLNEDQVAKVKDVLASILAANLQKEIGESHLTAQGIEDKRILELKKEMGLTTTSELKTGQDYGQPTRTQTPEQSKVVNPDSKSDMGDLQQLIQGVVVDNDNQRDSMV